MHIVWSLLHFAFIWGYESAAGCCVVQHVHILLHLHRLKLNRNSFIFYLIFDKMRKLFVTRRSWKLMWIIYSIWETLKFIWRWPKLTGHVFCFYHHNHHQTRLFISLYAYLANDWLWLHVVLWTKKYYYYCQSQSTRENATSVWLALNHESQSFTIHKRILAHWPNAELI